MDGIKNKIRRVKYDLGHGVFSFENVVLIIAVLLCFFWTYKTIESMSRNWELSEELSVKSRELELLKLETQAAELENEYYSSNEYQELLARKLANKQLAGEKMVYLPENTEVAKNKYKVEEKLEVEEKEYSNFEKWMMFLFPSR